MFAHKSDGDDEVDGGGSQGGTWVLPRYLGRGWFYTSLLSLPYYYYYSYEALCTLMALLSKAVCMMIFT